VSDLIVAFGLVLVIEGVLYRGFPGLARRMAAEAGSAPEGAMRAIGLAAIAAGVLIVWLARG